MPSRPFCSSVGRLAALTALAVCALLAAAAPRTPSDFQLHAEIEVLAPLRAGEAYAVAMERDVIAAHRRSRELRVFDARGREVPSLTLYRS